MYDVLVSATGTTSSQREIIRHECKCCDGDFVGDELCEVEVEESKEKFLDFVSEA